MQTYWQAFLWPFGIAVAVAVAIGLLEPRKSPAYLKAMYAGTTIVFLPSCAPLLSGNHQEGEAFFWLLPLNIWWFVAGPAAVMLARLIRWSAGK